MLKIAVFYEKDLKNDFKNEIQKRNQQGAFWNNMDEELLEKQHQEIQDVKALESQLLTITS